jgi:HSP90 family molecular chaperone
VAERFAGCAAAAALQVGVIEDTENRERLSKLLRFHSSKSETDMVGLQEYVGRMKEGQKGIYYMVRPCMLLLVMYNQ